MWYHVMGALSKAKYEIIYGAFLIQNISEYEENAFYQLLDHNFNDLSS